MTSINVTRQDGTVETVEVLNPSIGGVGFRSASDFFLRRVQENPDVWECRCLIAIMGNLHQCLPGEENGDPFDDNCTANYSVGRGMTKEQAVQALCDQLRKQCDHFWETP